jgi:hypothetical protein
MPRTPKKRVEYKLIEHPPWRYEDLRNRMPRPPEKMKPAEYLRWRNKTLRQWRSKPPSDTERAEKLELLKRLSRNELTPSQRKTLVSEVLRLWFPKEWAALWREFDNKEVANACRFFVRLEAEKKGCSIADAKKSPKSLAFKASRRWKNESSA